MSDDTFDDSLLEDYEVNKGGVYGEEESNGFLPEPSLKKGLGIAIIVTILLELGVGLALNVDTNLVHRYIAYMLGLVPIFIAAVYTRSILKMFFVGAPVIIITSFALPYFLPNIFSGLMTPFLTLLPIVERATTLLVELGALSQEQADLFELVERYGILLDFFFGILVGLFAAIGLTAFIKLVSGKPGILSIFTFIFGSIFLLIGVIILPYFLVITSGIAHFSMAFGVGGAVLAEGTAISADPNGDFDRANDLFAEAQDWFEEAEQILEGLEALGLFGLISSADPTIRIIVENGLVLMNAAVDLAQGLSPAFAGFGAMSRGMDQAMGSLENSSQTASLMLSQETDFEEGLDLVEQGLANFTLAVPEIQEAITTIYEGVNRQELEDALDNEDAKTTLDLIFSALPLLELTLDVFTNDDNTGLIDDPDGIENDTERSPIVHLLLGSRSMSEVQEIIGETSNFQGTGPAFADLVYHLQFVVDSLDSSNNPAVGDLEEFELEESAPEDIVNLKDQITGAVNFLKDAGNTTISIGRFGIVASPTLRSMNNTITFLTSSSDFTSLSQTEYQNAINVFDGNATFSPGIVQNTTIMQSRARNVRNQINNLENGAGNDTYGFFNVPAEDFVTEFRAFNLTKNADNLKFIASGFSSMIKAMSELTIVDSVLIQIDNNVTLIQSEIDEAQIDVAATDYTFAVPHLNNAQDSVTLIKTDIVTANDTLQIGKGHLFNSSLSFNQTRDMPQLADTGAALGRISIKMENIQVGNGTAGIEGLTGISNKINSIETTIDDLLPEATGDNGAYDYTSDFNQIEADINGIINEVSFIETEFAGIQVDLADVSIAS